MLQIINQSTIYTVEPLLSEALPEFDPGAQLIRKILCHVRIKYYTMEQILYWSYTKISFYDLFLLPISELSSYS